MNLFKQNYWKVGNHEIIFGIYKDSLTKGYLIHKLNGKKISSWNIPAEDLEFRANALYQEIKNKNQLALF